MALVPLLAGCCPRALSLVINIDNYGLLGGMDAPT